MIPPSSLLNNVTLSNNRIKSALYRICRAFHARFLNQSCSSPPLKNLFQQTASPDFSHCSCIIAWFCRAGYLFFCGHAAAWRRLTRANGARYAITNTCAANVLGHAKPGMHAYGNPESARRAIAALAEMIGKSVEDRARAILDIATDKVIPVVDDRHAGKC